MSNRPTVILRATLPLFFGLALMGPALHAQEAASPEAKTLAQQLRNPLADLISVPVAINWDFGIGDTDAMRFTSSFQPVIPFAVNAGWLIVTRTTLSVFAGAGPAGVGDITESLFVSPKTTVNGWVWGAGPIILLPTASNALLGGERWGAGPTAAVLRQAGAWSYGVLVNQIWSFAGNTRRDDVNAGVVYPFLSYTMTSETTFALEAESSYGWAIRRWTVPIEAQVAQLVTLGRTPIQLMVALRYYVTRPLGEARWGTGIGVTFLLPR